MELITGLLLVAAGVLLAWLLRPRGIFLDRDEQRQVDAWRKRGRP